MDCYGTFVLSKNLVYLVCPAIRTLMENVFLRISIYETCLRKVMTALGVSYLFATSALVYYKLVSYIKTCVWLLIVFLEII